MPTQAEWERALHTPRRYEIESSPALIADVAARVERRAATAIAKGHAPPPTKALDLAPGLPAHCDQTVAPVQILHRLGAVTTPPVPNLADLSATWAYLRYVWAFAPSIADGDPLRLSEAAGKIDFHQKTLMSDHLGIGMAAVVMEEIYGVGEATDVDVAVRGGVEPIELIYDTSPDYLYHDNTGAIRFVVECKGTRGTRYKSTDQLRRGLEQLPSLVFTDGRPNPTGLVIGTMLDDKVFRVLVVDPPSDERDRERSEKERVFEIEDSESFSRRARAYSWAKAATFAGALASSRRLLQRAGFSVESPEIPEPDLDELQTDRGRFQGKTQTLFAPEGRRIGVYQGIDADLLELIRGRDLVGSPEPGPAEIDRQTGGPPPTTREDIEGGVAITSHSIDGTVLQIRVFG